MRILSVAEKNDGKKLSWHSDNDSLFFYILAAKGIANQLSRGGYNRREGLSKYNKNYEFSAPYQVNYEVKIVF